MKQATGKPEHHANPGFPVTMEWIRSGGELRTPSPTELKPQRSYIYFHPARMRKARRLSCPELEHHHNL